MLVAVAYAVAAIGTQGFFGVQPDGLAAIWLILVGLPWNLVLGPLIVIGFPTWLGQVIAVLSPLLTLFILARYCGRD